MVVALLLFGLKLILSAIAIVGFYLITRGQWNIKPDGTREWGGKIFSFWSRFLQMHKCKRIYYKGNELYKLIDRLKKNPLGIEIEEIAENCLVTKKLSETKKHEFWAACFNKEGVECEFRPDGENQIITFFQNKKEFVLPSLITYPLGECITCMSSFFGTACYWFWYWIDKPELPLNSILGLWIFFCISLSFLNEFLFGLNHKLKD